MTYRRWHPDYGWLCPPIAGGDGGNPQPQEPQPQEPQPPDSNAIIAALLASMAGGQPAAPQILIDQQGRYVQVFPDGRVVPLTQPAYGPGIAAPTPIRAPQDAPALVENYQTNTYWQWTGSAWRDTGMPLRPTGGGAATVPITINGETFQVSNETAAALAQRNYEFGNLSAAERRGFLQDVLQFNAGAAQNRFANWLAEAGFTEDVRQFNASLAESQRQFDVGLAEDQRQFAQRMGLDYDRLAADIGAANADRMLEYARLTGDIQAGNALRRFQSAENAKERALALADLQITDERARATQRQQNIAQRQSLARDVAEFARAPGDIGQFAAFLRAAGPNPISTAVQQGQSAVTNESLAPLAANLGLMGELQQEQAELRRQPGIFSSLAGLMQPTAVQDVPLPPLPQAVQTPQRIGPDFSGMAPRPGLVPTNYQGQWIDAAGTVYDAAGNVIGTPTTTRTPTQSPPRYLAEGGKTNAQMLMVGEKGPEILMNPMNAPVIVMPMEKMARAQSGGMFGDLSALLTLAGGAPIDPTALAQARAFLAQVAEAARLRAGFPEIPTPVGVSAPGTDPFLQELAAGVTGTARGVPQESFLREAALSAPKSLAERVVRRTR